MDEIVRQVAERTGLPEAQARMAVETVIRVLKERLPEPLAGQVDNYLTGGGGAGGGLGDIGGALGGLLGKR